MSISRDFRQGMGGGIVSVSAGPGLARQIQTVRNSDGISDFFFHKHFLETKAPIRPAVRRLVWAFVVPIYQRRISRDKVHTIFKKSKLNFKIYTRNARWRLCRGCIVFAFPFVRSSFPIIVRLLVRS